MNGPPRKYRVNEQGMVIEYVNDLTTNRNTEEPIPAVIKETGFRASQDTKKKPSLEEKKKSPVEIRSFSDDNEDAYHPDMGN